jgi:hypothetical protein
MISSAETEYVEFSRPPYAVDPAEDQLIVEAARRGVACRLLFESCHADDPHLQKLAAFRGAGVEIRHLDRLPMKLAVFDGTRGMVALLDPLVTKPTWTAVVFDHPGMGEAMKGLFEEYWRRAG